MTVGLPSLVSAPPGPQTTAMTTPLSEHDITSLDQLRQLYREPVELAKLKKGPVIEGGAAEFVARSPFCCLATAGADGTCDVSPRGGPAGQVKVLAEGRAVALPDLSGNNLLDSLTNIVVNPWAGLLVMVPGSDETMRIDGRAKLTTDPEILNLWSDEVRTPKLAMVIEVDSAFLHCAKAFRRGGVWKPETWSVDDGKSTIRMFNALAGTDFDPDALRPELEKSYAADLAGEQIT